MKKAIQIFVVIISFSLIISCGYMIIKSQGNSKNLSLSVEEQLASLYENEEDYKGLEIYHIEFWNSNDKKSEYDEAINKYSYPIKTTINELNKDFPFDQRNRSNVATPQCSIDINNDEDIWVYASYDNSYDGGNVKLHYNKLDLLSNRLEIKTEFIRESGGTSSNKKLIVLTIVPVNQSITDLWGSGENYELEYTVSEDDYLNDWKYKKAAKKYEIPTKTTVKQLSKDIKFDNRNIDTVCTPFKRFDLSMDEEIWVYSSMFYNYNGEKIQFIYDDINIYKDSVEIKTHFNSTNNTGAKGQLIIVFSVIPVNQPITDLCKGIKNYELEFQNTLPVSDSEQGKMDYNEKLSKYLKPVKTTVRELDTDFPLVYANTRNIVTPVQEFDLNLDDEIWAFASCYDSFQGGPVMMKYDVLEISEQELQIKTHFEVDNNFHSSAKKNMIIVISLIPINQD